MGSPHGDGPSKLSPPVSLSHGRVVVSSVVSTPSWALTECSRLRYSTIQLFPVVKAVLFTHENIILDIVHRREYLCPGSLRNLAFSALASLCVQGTLWHSGSFVSGEHGRRSAERSIEMRGAGHCSISLRLTMVSTSWLGPPLCARDPQ